MNQEEPAWDHVLAVTRPALSLASPAFIDQIADRLREAGVQDAVAQRDSAAVFGWLMSLVALQGISDAAAFAFDAEHGGVAFSDLDAALATRPPCPLLRSYWNFADCGYRKGSGLCAQPEHQRACLLPRIQLRKGALNVAAISLYLFIRDVCGGDFVGWVDHRLAAADPGRAAPGRAVVMREALLGPLVNVGGTGPKLWSMILPDLLLASDPERERWVTTGASFVAIDSLVHNLLHSTGVLRRLAAEHPYGPACYRPGGCAEVIERLASRVDAREFNPHFPATFPRFIQHALWSFCAAGGRSICNGNRIDDGRACSQRFCPISPVCDRVSLREEHETDGPAK